MKAQWLVVIGLVFLSGACSGAREPTEQVPSVVSPDRAVVGVGAAPSEGVVAKESLANAPVGGGTGETLASGNLLDRKLVENADLTLEVKDVQDSLQAARNIAQSYGGFVASSNLRYEGERRVGVITLRVPSARFNDAMSQLRALALEDGVKAETSSVKDVTEEYTDLEARLRTLRATEAQYLELLKSARTIQEILTVQDRLNQVRAQIEQTQGRMQVLDRLSDLATINVRLTPPLPLVEAPAWSPVRILEEAWASAAEALRGVTALGIYALVFVWLWGPLAALTLWVRGRRMRPASPTPPSVGA